MWGRGGNTIGRHRVRKSRSYACVVCSHPTTLTTQVQCVPPPSLSLPLPFTIPTIPHRIPHQPKQCHHLNLPRTPRIPYTMLPDLPPPACSRVHYPPCMSRTMQRAYPRTPLFACAQRRDEEQVSEERDGASHDGWGERFLI